MSTDIELPPVGQPQGVIVVGTPTGPQAMSAFTGAYVQDYARAAVLADRERREPCEWHTDEDGLWWSACRGDPWVFNDAGPVENNVKHCMHCGHPVVVAEPPADKERTS